MKAKELLSDIEALVREMGEDAEVLLVVDDISRGWMELEIAGVGDVPAGAAGYIAIVGGEPTYHLSPDDRREIGKTMSC